MKQMSQQVLSTEDEKEIISQVQDIVLNNSKSSDELYQVIGSAIYHDAALRIAPKGTNGALQYTGLKKSLNLQSTFSLLSGTPTISSDAAQESGKSFFNNIFTSIKKFICSNKDIQKFIDGGDSSTVGDVVKAILPSVLTAIGISVATGLLPSIIAAVIGLILKELLKLGYSAFCDIKTK